MKVYEIISERNEKLNEFLGFGVLGKIAWQLFVAYELTAPVTKAWTALQSNFELLKNNDPSMPREKFDQQAAHILAQCSIELGGLILGNRFIGKIVSKLGSIPGIGSVASYFSGILKALGQYEFMKWVNSEKVAQVISDWLTGLIFTDKFPVIGQSGPLYEKYVGNGLLKALEEIKPGVETLRKKVFKDEPDQQIPSPSQQDINATSTPPSSTSTNVAPSAVRSYSPSLNVSTGIPGAPDRPNVSFK